MFSYISKCFRSLSRAPGVCLMSLVSHGCSRSSDLRRSAYFDHLSGLRKRWSKKAERRFCKLGLFRPPFSDSGKMVEKGRASILQARLISTTFFREWSCSHVRPEKSQARKRRLGPAKIDWLIQPGTVHQHHERHLSRKKKERTSAVE